MRDGGGFKNTGDPPFVLVELDGINTTAYLCGHTEMIEHSKAILKRRGFTDKGSIKEEVYWVPTDRQKLRAPGAPTLRQLKAEAAASIK